MKINQQVKKIEKKSVGKKLSLQPSCLGYCNPPRLNGCSNFMVLLWRPTELLVRGTNFIWDRRWEKTWRSEFSGKAENATGKHGQIMQLPITLKFLFRLGWRVNDICQMGDCENETVARGWLISSPYISIWLGSHIHVRGNWEGPGEGQSEGILETRLNGEMLPSPQTDISAKGGSFTWSQCLSITFA